MPLTKESIVDAALALPAKSRVALVGKLLDSLANIGERGRHHARNGVFGGDGRVFVRRVKRHDIVEAFAELLHLVVSELPVARLRREPQLRVAHLLQRHDLAQPW